MDRDRDVLGLEKKKGETKEARNENLYLLKVYRQPGVGREYWNKWMNDKGGKKAETWRKVEEEKTEEASWSIF